MKEEADDEALIDAGFIILNRKSVNKMEMLDKTLDTNEYRSWKVLITN